MARTRKSASSACADLLQNMIPGARYELNGIVALAGVGIPAAKELLARLITEKSVRTVSVRQRFVYWRPTQGELDHERQNAKGPPQSLPTLRGYDASLRQLQTLSMLARPRPPDNPDT